jgi:hypothetical protein
MNVLAWLSNVERDMEPANVRLENTKINPMKKNIVVDITENNSKTKKSKKIIKSKEKKEKEKKNKNNNSSNEIIII